MKCDFFLKMHQNAFAAALRPGPLWELTVLLRPVSCIGRHGEWGGEGKGRGREGKGGEMEV